MTSQPNIGMRIESGYIVVEILGGIVVPVLLFKGSNEAGGVACVCRGLTVADLAPQKLAALTAAAAEEEIVVDLVVGGSIGTVEHGRRGSLETDDDCRVVCISEDVPTQAIRLPAKVFCVVETTPYVNPVSCVWLEDVCI